MIKVLIKTFVYLYHHYRMTNFKCIPNLLNYSAIFRIIYVICWTLWLAGLWLSRVVRYRPWRRADHSSRSVLLNVELVVCYQETSEVRRLWTAFGRSAKVGKIYT